MKVVTWELKDAIAQLHRIEDYLLRRADDTARWGDPAGEDAYICAANLVWFAAYRMEKELGE